MTLKEKFVFVALLAAAIGLSGCTVVQYEKTVSTKRDGNGKVIEQTITETLREPHQELPKFESAGPQRLDMK